MIKDKNSQYQLQFESDQCTTNAFCAFNAKTKNPTNVGLNDKKLVILECKTNIYVEIWTKFITPSLIS